LQSLSAKVANLVVDDEERTREFMELLENQLNNLTISIPRTSCGSNLLSQGSVKISSDCGGVARTSSGAILDPQCTKTKGAPKKLRQKGPLEMSTNKRKVCLQLYFSFLISIGSIKCSHITLLSIFFAHVTSKSSKGKRPMKNNAQPGQATRDAVNLVLTPLTYSQQMMVRNC